MSIEIYEILTKEKTMDMSKFASGDSQYLKAADLEGNTPQVKIAKVETADFDDDEKGSYTKPVLSFEGRSKGVVLNTTNTKSLISGFGSDSVNWVGKTVMLSTKSYPGFADGIVVTPIKEGESDVPF